MFEVGGMLENKKYLCPNCERKVGVYMVKKNSIIEIKKEKIEYVEKQAHCVECKQHVPVKEYEEERENMIVYTYCKKHNLITIEEIERILRLYDVDKRQLPFIIDVGEHTIERYLKGQIPNEKISNMLRRYLSSYRMFAQKFEENMNDERITGNTKRKVSNAIERLDKLNSCNSKIEAVALYIINSKYDITNLALQKLLYYADAISMLKNKKELFDSNCQAWIHGPVYPGIYDKFKCFGREQIYDCDLNEAYMNYITEEDRDIINYVLNNFAIYNGKILEFSTHREKPWMEVREGYLEEENCNEIINKSRINQYFEALKDKYNLLEPLQVENYIRQVL